MNLLQSLLRLLPFRHTVRRAFRRLPILNTFRSGDKKGKWRKILGLLIVGLIAAHFFAPAQHVPWKPLDVDAPIGLATGIKINLISRAPDGVCQDKLNQATHLRQNSAPDKSKGSCGYDNANAMSRRGEISFSPSASVVAQCPVVLSSYIWLGRVDALAREHFNSPLAKIHHAGTYSCRRQVGNGSKKWSQHAFANAWDITGFELQNGDVISVAKHWPHGLQAQFFGRDPKGHFLMATRDAACRVFKVVLSPDFNAAHHDHFHLDHGSKTSCS